jgi:hypothetical protein
MRPILAHPHRDAHKIHLAALDGGQNCLYEALAAGALRQEYRQHASQGQRASCERVLFTAQPNFQPARETPGAVLWIGPDHRSRFDRTQSLDLAAQQ